jgi:hypothetical protein
MEPFLTGAARTQAQERDLAREEVHPLDWQDDFGPLKYTQLADFVAHMQAIERAGEDPAREHELCIQFGYQDISHFRRVRATFLKYWGDPNDHHELRYFAWKEPEFSQALMVSMQAQGARDAEAALARDPALAAPEEGLSLERYGWVCAQVAGRQVAMPELQRILAAVGLDVPTWERVNKAWAARMSRDASGTLTTLFTKAFQAGSAGGQPGGGEPMSLARYAEIAAVTGAWAEEGKNVDAMLHQTYRITSGDLATAGIYWQQRFLTDVRLLGEYDRLMEEHRSKHARHDPDADLVFGGPGRGGQAAAVFANAAATSQQAPWANEARDVAVVLSCPVCGARQEKALDFRCRYCHAPMGAS